MGAIKLPPNYDYNKELANAIVGLYRRKSL